jgi:hypothetical protein
MNFVEDAFCVQHAVDLMFWLGLLLPGRHVSVVLRVVVNGRGVVVCQHYHFCEEKNNAYKFFFKLFCLLVEYAFVSQTFLRKATAAAVC